MRNRQRPIITNILVLLFLVVVLTTSASAKTVMTWQETLEHAKGQTVDWYMWGGSTAVNSYVNGYLVKEVKDRFDITLRQVPVKDIAAIVSKLVIEKQANKTSDGSVDLMWINGENFRTCKKLDLLYGPFTDRLPNQQYVDWTSPTVKNDFGTSVDGMESPWGSAQMVMIYDSARTPEPPRSVDALIKWIKAHPGKFSYPAPPDFTGSAFIRHIFYNAAESSDIWQGDYSEADFQAAAQTTYATLNDLKSSLWRKGSTYPDSPVRMNTLFTDREIDFSFSYHQGEASRNILDGIFADTVRTFVFNEGTIANTHFVAIPFNAQDKPAAMVVANFLLSPEAQLKKAAPEVWGDFPAISAEKLPQHWQERFRSQVKGVATLGDEELQSHQLPEPPSKILIDLEKGWQQHVLRNR